MKVEDETITAKMIFLTIGSGVIIPKIKGLEETGYLTSDTLLKLTSLPKSIAIVGGGYIAAEVRPLSFQHGIASNDHRKKLPIPCRGRNQKSQNSQ